MNILFIDLSLNSTGWCAGATPDAASAYAPPERDTLAPALTVLPPIQHAAGGDIGGKLANIRARLREELAAGAEAGLIVLEDIFIGPNRQTGLTLAHCHGVVLCLAAELGIPDSFSQFLFKLTLSRRR